MTSESWKRYRLRHSRVALVLLVVMLLLSAFPTLPIAAQSDEDETGGDAATTAPTEPATAIPWREKTSPFGIVATLGNRVREDEMDEVIALMNEAGVQWQREEIFWDRIQKEPNGPFDWDGDGSGFYNYDRAIAMQHEAGINILGLLDYNPYWFKGKNPHPDEWIDDWGNYVYATVARYGRDRGQIKYWELWNEPNLAKSGYDSGLYEVKDFVRLLQVGHAAAKAADPEAKIVMGGMASIWGEPPNQYNYDYFTYLDIVGQLGGWNYVDIIAVHPYRPDAPEGELLGRQQGVQDFRTEMNDLDELMLRYGTKPIWITEMGWASNTLWPGVNEDTQAFFLIRMYVMAITHPSIERVFWYDLRNDTIPEAPYEQPIYSAEDKELNYGLVRRFYPLDTRRSDLRKPAFLAYRTMTQTLAGTWLLETVSEDDRTEWPGVYWYRFGNNERRVDVMWRTSDVTPELTVNCDCEEALVRRWNGEARYLLISEDNTLRLKLEDLGAPIFIEYDPPVAAGGDYFAETGQSLRGAFRNYWYANGGVERFGFPLTEELTITQSGTGLPLTVQYFERARFEHFPGSPNEIMLSRLGEVMLQRRGVLWQDRPRRADAPEECRFFPETGHAVCPPLLATWEQYRGLEGLGFPLTEMYEELDPATNATYLVQYFERARLEYVPGEDKTRSNGEREAAPPPGYVRFGNLGSEYLVQLGGMP